MSESSSHLYPSCLKINNSSFAHASRNKKQKQMPLQIHFLRTLYIPLLYVWQNPECALVKSANLIPSDCRTVKIYIYSVCGRLAIGNRMASARTFKSAAFQPHLQTKQSRPTADGLIGMRTFSMRVCLFSRGGWTLYT